MKIKKLIFIFPVNNRNQGFVAAFKSEAAHNSNPSLTESLVNKDLQIGPVVKLTLPLESVEHLALGQFQKLRLTLS